MTSLINQVWDQTHHNIYDIAVLNSHSFFKIIIISEYYLNCI
jgi:hypothetical protein